MIQNDKEIKVEGQNDNFLKQRMDLLSSKDKRLAIQEIMRDFNVSKNTVYRWLRLDSADLPIVLHNYGKPKS
jgi:predicted DNA-binding transcriptional regulator YafY